MLSNHIQLTCGIIPKKMIKSKNNVQNVCKKLLKVINFSKLEMQLLLDHHFFVIKFPFIIGWKVQSKNFSRSISYV